MNKVVLMSIMYSCLLWAVDARILPRNPVYGPRTDGPRTNQEVEPKGTYIDDVRDERSILGPSGKNICADTTGRNIAVQYGMNASSFST